ncbi:MAG: flagellar assembly protein FliW [Lachnospiraceae bacterium]|nr:flagellar assembly protein FliW [Lachnospiraceae bacterium]MDE6698207.1 flagellar assembly protein FliW [Lachnospiraceae bacterium]
MKMTTNLFGEILVDDNKVINFIQGIIGFPDLKKFMLIHDSESEDKKISWLQSIDEPSFALPVIDPLVIDKNYNPEIEDELLNPLEIKKIEDLLVVTTVTVPSDIKNMTVNMKAPIIINAANLKAAQLIVEDDKYLVKYPVYDILKGNKEGDEVC